MSISKLQAALTAATNEVTVAAANINFDFTLIKYEAPKEYQPLGETLSIERRRNAETGKIHITARRLGALFEGICPSTPNLVKAYGTRVSEISRHATDQASSQYSNSIFSAYSGVDGTSIWAAATSSKAALHVHLLSCMLARAWQPSEAISVWAELIEERRKNIARKLQDGEMLSYELATAAAQQEIPRSQLAEWDASARAWLRTADAVKIKQQTQIRLVIENINLHVDSGTLVYDSVIESWKSALGIMERLVAGESLAVQHGAAVLGLSSWHIYPDIAVFGTKNGTIEIRMEDPLVAKGSFLQLGLHRSRDDAISGICWSLSLAHMRYYGAPVRAQSFLSGNPSRISFQELQIAVLGTILGCWAIPIEDTSIAIETILSLGELLGQAPVDGVQGQWTDMITQPAAEFLFTRQEEQDLARKLILLGRRRSQVFVPRNTERPELPFFGLTNELVLLQCLKGPEEKIALLRRVMSRMNYFEDSITLLRYYHDEDKEIRLRPKRQRKAVIDGAHWFGNIARYATVFPQQSSIPEPVCQVNIASSTLSHHRWLQKGQTSANSPQEEHHKNGSAILDSSPMEIMDTRNATALTFSFGDVNSAAVFSSKPRIPLTISANDILWCLKSEYVCPQKLKIFATGTNQDRPIFKMLDALYNAHRIYRTLPDANVTVNVLNQSMLETKWFASIDLFLRGNHKYRSENSGCARYMLEVGRHVAMSVVAYFDGCHDIDSSLLEEAMAFSAGDSIYVAMQLVCDPFEQPHPFELKRILGNTGKPGTVFLIPPRDSMVRALDVEHWMFVNSHGFDGVAEDCFSRTSLHLSFTDYLVPLFNSQGRGNRDNQVSLQEAIISVRDSGVWIADIDILGTLKKVYVHRLESQLCSIHSRSEGPQQHLTSIQSWDDILDCPDGNIVVKAHKNWIARLATLTVLAQHSRIKDIRLTICSPETCWKCVNLGSFSQNAYIY